MRRIFSLVAILLLAGCGATGTATPFPTVPPSPNVAQSRPVGATQPAIAAAGSARPTPPTPIPDPATGVATRQGPSGTAPASPLPTAAHPASPVVPASAPPAPPAASPFVRYTANQALAELIPEGVTGVRDGVRGPDEAWPNAQVEWKVFSYAGVSADRRGGQLLIYATEEGLAAMNAYLDTLPADLTMYRYVHGNALLFLSPQIDPTDARRLREAFARLP